jgi:hypothetical protein
LTAAPADIRDQLEVDEANFRMVAGPAHGSARDYFVYGTLDEIQKAGIAIMKWDEFLGIGEEEPDPDDPITRVVIESCTDEQRLWQRKLVEALIDLANFHATNEDVYYRDFLLLKDLQRLRSTSLDLADFYAAPSANLAWAANRTFEDIRALEDGGELDLGRCWYRKTRQPLRSADAHPSSLFASVRSRLRTGLEHMTAAEKSVVGLSYDRVFGEASRDIHFRPTATIGDVNIDAVVRGLNHVALLGLNSIVRIQRLTGLVPDGVNRQIRTAFDSNEYPAQLVASMSGGRAEVGDFVLAYGDLGEVVAVARSPFGYESYRVRFLAERPLPDVDEDWFIAQHIQRLYTDQRFLDALGPMVADGTVTDDFAQAIRDAPLERRHAAVRDAIVAVWGAGLQEWFRGQPQPPTLPRPTNDEADAEG